MHSYSFLKRLHFIILSFVILAPWGRLRRSQSISLDHGKYSGLRSSSWHLPSFPVAYCFDFLSRRRDRSGFSPDSNLRSAYTDYHEIMRFVFLIFVFLLCNICYLVVKIFECFYRISLFVSITFWYFIVLSAFLLDQCGNCFDRSIWTLVQTHILLLWYFWWSALMPVWCILFLCASEWYFQVINFCVRKLS